MTIRNFEEKDAADVSRLMFESFYSVFGKRLGTEPHSPEYWIRCSSGKTPDSETAAFVAEENGRAAGYISVTANLWCGLGVLNEIGVDPHAFSHGIGTALYRHAEEWWTERKMRKLYTCTASINPRAQAFYRKMGFLQEGLLKKHYFPDVDELQLSKFLS